tara:strand:- start:4603 stop:4866 length:264 start_codon:yes stop_codon:yes gene_type:complete
MNVEFRYQFPELLLTGSFLLFNSGNNQIAWVFFICGVIASITRLGVSRSEKEEDKKDRDAQWENLRQQLLQAQMATPVTSDDDYMEH